MLHTIYMYIDTDRYEGNISKCKGGSKFEVINDFKCFLFFIEVEYIANCVT